MASTRSDVGDCSNQVSIRHAHPTAAVRRTAVYALHYAALVDAGKAPDPSRDPFAPLVYMYELGGSFAPDQVGGVQIGIASFGVGKAADWLGQPAPAGLPEFPNLAGIWPRYRLDG